MRRPITICLCAAAGALSAYYGQPYARDNSDAVTILITVMTVFAGFLVAIIAVVGDPALIPDGSWRTAEHRRDNIESRLIAYSWLFTLYLLAIGFLFVGALLNKAPATSVPDEWKTWIERIYLFCGASSFFLTFGLPKTLLRMQLARVDGEVKRRRTDAGLKD